MKNTKRMIPFTDECLQLLDNALDLLYERGFYEIKFEPEKVIGTTTLTYSVVRNDSLQRDILVRLTYQAGKCELKFFNNKKEEIPFKELVSLPVV